MNYPMNNSASFDVQLEQAAQERLRRYLAALPAEEALRAEYGPLRRLDRRVRRSLRRVRQEQARENEVRPRRFGPRARRLLLVAALVAALMASTLTASAELRLWVKNTLVEWGARNMTIRYEVEGTPLSALPEGYGAHYIPEGFTLDTDETQFFENKSSFHHVYYNEAGSYIALDVLVEEGSSSVQTDTEHTTYRQVDYGDGDAWLGTFEDGDGYVLDWVRDGVENHLYISAVLPEDEVFRIADGVY